MVGPGQYLCSTQYLPCRPPLYYILLFMLRLAVWAGTTMSFEMFGVMTVYCGMNFMTFIMMFPTLNKDFVPSKQKKPPNKHRSSSWVSTGLAIIHAFLTPVITYLEQIPCYRKPRKSVHHNTCRGRGKYLFTLRL